MVGMDWHRQGASTGRKGSGRGLDHGSSLLPQQRCFFFSRQMPSAHTDTQVIKNEALLYPPFTLTRPLPHSASFRVYLFTLNK